MKKPNKMEAVKEVLSANPNASPSEIVSALAKQKIKITTNVVSNYKSLIRAGAKKSASKPAARGQASKSQAKAPKAQLAKATPSRNGSASHGFEPSVVELLKVGRSLGWRKVKTIVELMLEP